MRITTLIGVATVGLLCQSTARAGVSKQDAEFFESKVKPVLTENCFKCHSHSAEKIKGGLVLDSLSGLMKGGDSGPAIVPGKPEESLLVKAISYTDPDLQMPPKDKKLSTEQIEILKAWIKRGVPWPGADVAKIKVRGKITDEDRAWWAFQPLHETQPPAVKETSRVANVVDQFVLAKLESSGLELAPTADKRTLLRRVYLDLVGLPPSAEETKAFLNDSNPKAYEQVVDRLLDSPHYGERWARHWLDLVRYAESDGYKADGYRPSAWLYRDYVIKSLNEDKAYDHFVREQLAGDELAPENPDAVVATMFLRHWIYEYNNPDARGQWEAILNELTDVAGDVFMGMGMSCARCHDHKFDPILQKDYFRLQAFFAPILPVEDVPVATTAQKAEYQKQLALWEDATKETRAEMSVIEKEYRDQNFEKAALKMPEDLQALMKKPASERTPLEEQVTELAYRQVAPAFEQLETKLKGAKKDEYIGLQKKLAEFDALRPKPLTNTYAVTDVGPKAPPVFIPKARNKEEIPPGFLSVLDERPAEIKSVQTAPNSTGRRAALAEWLTRPNNPLSTRVIVNRVWQEHFGRGIVATPSDFGKLGQPPSHPELLDWLTIDFVKNGWSLKRLHRLIVTSETYRQSSASALSEVALKKDPENLLLWHANIRRMDADQVRDSFLAVSHELDLSVGGPSVDSSKPRRSIYTKVRRNTHDPLLQAFDAPDNIGSTPQRNVTTTPTQSLLMFNNQTVIARARALAAYAQKQSATERDLISGAFEFALDREPAAWETPQLLQFMDEQTERIRKELANPKPRVFLAEPLPARDGRAALVDKEGPQQKFMVPDSPSMPDGDFTIETVVLMKAVGDGPLLAIASQSEGVKTQPGWIFGVTGKKSSQKPQRLALQLSSNAAKGSGDELLVSEVPVDLNKTYYLAATVRFGANTNDATVTFYAKNLANDDDPQISQTHHHVAQPIQSTAAFVIGSIAGENTDYQFEGLVDEVRLSRGALKQDKLMLTSEELTPEVAGFWQLKSEKDYFRDRSQNANNIQLKVEDRSQTNPRFAAFEDVCHVLLNSNEFLYID